jgi:tetratricopeptide (TPR) repeat protein
MKKMLFGFALLFAVLVSANAKENNELAGPLLEGLGDLHHPITTPSQKAQRYFDQGLLLCYAFNHDEAIRSFRSAAMLDPDCAMAYWGIALAYGPHVNKPMSEADNTAAWTALQQALARQKNATKREQDYIGALSKRYEEQHREDRSALDKAYASAMRELVARYPDDLDARTLFAEALMDTMPWDYWLKDRSPKPETQEAFAALRFVLSRNANHPGANHYYIHAVEAGPNPEWGLASADRLLNYAPTAGHLVHMPSHIYIRVGQYRDAVMANERAVAADQSYIRQSRAQGFYPGVYYPHNIHFLWWAQLFEGQSAQAMKTAEKAAQYAVDNVCSPTQVLEAPRFRHLPWLTALRFGRFDELLRIPQPAVTNDFVMDRAIWHFVRGLAYASRDAADYAAREHEQLARLAKSEQARKMDVPQLPATGIIAVAEKWLAAKVAGARGEQQSMIRLLEEAVSLEDQLPYMEPAFWPLPARPALGAALLEVGEPVRAEKVFREDLERMPRNAWGLLGLEQALRAQGRNDAAAIVHRQFKETWKQADTPLKVAWF